MKDFELEMPNIRLSKLLTLSSRGLNVLVGLDTTVEHHGIGLSEGSQTPEKREALIAMKSHSHSLSTSGHSCFCVEVTHGLLKWHGDVI